MPKLYTRRSGYYYPQGHVAPPKRASPTRGVAAAAVAVLSGAGYVTVEECQRLLGLRGYPMPLAAAYTLLSQLRLRGLASRRNGSPVRYGPA